jgi:hypothetical protein
MAGQSEVFCRNYFCFYLFIFHLKEDQNIFKKFIFLLRTIGNEGGRHSVKCLKCHKYDWPLARATLGILPSAFFYSFLALFVDLFHKNVL